MQWRSIDFAKQICMSHYIICTSSARRPSDGCQVIAYDSVRNSPTVSNVQIRQKQRQELRIQGLRFIQIKRKVVIEYVNFLSPRSLTFQIGFEGLRF